MRPLGGRRNHMEKTTREEKKTITNNKAAPAPAVTTTNGEKAYEPKTNTKYNVNTHFNLVAFSFTKIRAQKILSSPYI